MFFAFLAAILLSLTLAESATPATASLIRCCLELVVFTTAAAFPVGWIGSLLVSRLQQPQAGERLRRVCRVYRAVAPWWAAGATTAAIWLAGWPVVVRRHLVDRFVLDELAILAPITVVFALLWWCLAGIERGWMLRVRKQAPSRRALFALLFRHYAGFLLAPILSALVLAELAESYADQLAGREWLVPLGMVLLLLLLFPLVLRRLWSTEPLPSGALRARLERAAARTGLKLREILVWRTHGCVVNAAVLGFVGVARFLLLTDELLARFDDDDLEAVLMHEAAHVRRRHLILRFGLILAPLATTMAAAGLAAEYRDLAGSAVHAALEPAPAFEGDSVWTLLSPLLLLAYGAVSLCWISRLLEFDADAHACRYLSWHPHHSDAEPADRYCGMLERLAEASGVDPDRRSWLHPSINERIEMLEPEGAGRRLLLQRQWRATIVSYVLLATAPLVLAWWMLF